MQTEQIVNEYKIRARACHPDKHLDNPTAGKYTVQPVKCHKIVYYCIFNFILRRDCFFIFCKHAPPIFASLVADFQKLQEAKDILCNEDTRKNYDLWKRSGVTIPFHDWQTLKDSVKTVCNVFTRRYISIQRWCFKIKICILYWSSVCSQCTGP